MPREARLTLNLKFVASSSGRPESDSPFALARLDSGDIRYLNPAGDFQSRKGEVETVPGELGKTMLNIRSNSSHNFDVNFTFLFNCSNMQKKKQKKQIQTENLSRFRFQSKFLLA